MTNLKLRPEIKEQWLSALRSGEYPQARGTLHRLIPTSSSSVGYCCWGVLCEVLDLSSRPVLDWDEDGSTDDVPNASVTAYWVGDHEERGETGMPPDDLLALLFVDVNAHDLRRDDRLHQRVNAVAAKLADLNDSEERTFLEIADYVEEHL